MTAPSFHRMIEVLKGTWIYKFKAGKSRTAAGEFTAMDIKEVIFEEQGMVIRILITMKDGAVRVVHPDELNMRELEALTTWAENLRGTK